MIYETESLGVYTDDDGAVYMPDWEEKTGWWKSGFELVLEGRAVSFGNLSETSQKHIAGCIKQGYVQGEICEAQGKESWGWWKANFELILEGRKISFSDLSEISKEHIADSIKQGYTQGEICEFVLPGADDILPGKNN